MVTFITVSVACCLDLIMGGIPVPPCHSSAVNIAYLPMVQEAEED